MKKILAILAALASMTLGATLLTATPATAASATLCSSSPARLCTTVYTSGGYVRSVTQTLDPGGNVQLFRGSAITVRAGSGPIGRSLPSVAPGQTISTSWTVAAPNGGTFTVNGTFDRTYQVDVAYSDSRGF